MLNIAIKNLIIFTLVMLAVHVFIKIKTHESFEQELPPLPVAPATCQDRKPTAELDQQFGCKPAPEYKCAPADYDLLTKEKPTEPVVMQGGESTGCGPYAGGPLPGTTCDPAFNKPTPAAQALPIKSDCVLDQPNPNAFLMLRQYENDNVINTGRWENLDLYDEFGEVFAEFSCDAYSG